MKHRNILLLLLSLSLLMTSQLLCDQRVKLGTYFSINAKPGSLSTTIPNYGFSAGYEMKFFYSSIGISSTFVPWFWFQDSNYSFYLDAGPRIPLYTGEIFEFSVPLAFRLSYFNYCAEAGDGACDNIKRLFAGGSFNLDFNWKIQKGIGVYFFASIYFLGKIKENSEYYYRDPREMVDNTRDEFYVGIHTGSGISYSF